MLADPYKNVKRHNNAVRFHSMQAKKIYLYKLRTTHPKIIFQVRQRGECESKETKKERKREIGHN